MTKDEALKPAAYAKPAGLALDLLFPAACVICARRGASLCQFCASNLRYNFNQLCPDCQKASPNGSTHTACAKRYGLDGILAAGEFVQARELVHACKYQGVKSLDQPLAEFLSRFLESFGYQEYFSQFELAPVPLHKKRRRFRGFNQSELLASKLAKTSCLRSRANLLIRLRDTETQTHLDREERKRNLQAAFALAANQSAKEKNFLLIDDVTTTGATLAECARTLKKAGANLVWGLVIARG